MKKEIKLNIRNLILLLFLIVLNNLSAQNFRTVWRTTTANESITIPTSGSGYNYTVNWGDGSAEDTGVTSDVSHSYSVAGDYTVTISGDFPRIKFLSDGNHLKIQSIEEWGSSIVWDSMSTAFYGCANLVNNALDVPNLTGVVDTRFMFANCPRIGTGTATNWNLWDTSNITYMRAMFRDATSFNKDISSWNVDKVTNMSQMFHGATIFNQNIGNWLNNTNELLDSSNMFREAKAFNQDISNWNVSKVTNMSGMFSHAFVFNQDIGTWDVSKVTNMASMFSKAFVFNQDISNWVTDEVENMFSMFTSTKFDYNIDNWNVEKVTDMRFMFSLSKQSALNYDKILIGWNAQNLQSGVIFTGGYSNYCSQEAKDARANIIATKGWTIADGGEDCSHLQYFTTKWKTDNTGTSSDTSITIPTTGSGYNYDVDWDNDGTFDEFGITGSVTHDFGAVGTYIISIRGTFPRIYFNNAGDKRKILSVENWGSSIAWDSMESAFRGCVNLVNNATDTPDLSNATSLSSMFSSCSNLGKGSATNWNSWIVSSITNTSSMFYGASSFNKNIGSWNVSNVENMASMFHWATAFNKDISNWNVDKVTTMNRMFYLASAFNQNIGSWLNNINELTDIGYMFNNATAFNQDIGDWNVSKVTNMKNAFEKASVFNQNLNNWNVSEVTNMGEMFKQATVFNGNISNWNVAKVKYMNGMFAFADAFNQDISNWVTTEVINMSSMFASAEVFNQNIGSWDVSKVTTMYGIFDGAIDFDQDLSNWNVSQVSQMNNMFNGVTLSTSNYDAILVGWDTLTLQSGVNFHGGNSKYCSTAAFNARANMTNGVGDNWTITDGGNDCSETYFITTWKTDNSGSTSNTSIRIPTIGSGYNYDVDWNNDGTFDELGITGTITHDFGTSGTYTITIRGDFPRIYFNNIGDNAKILSIDQWGDGSWTSLGQAFYGCTNLVINAIDIPDFSNMNNLSSAFEDCSNLGNGTSLNWNSWNISNVINMTKAFKGATNFNKDISSWSVSKVFNMSYIFRDAVAFNNDLSNWNVENVTNMSFMFDGATSFNQNIGNWNVGKVSNMSYMFDGAISFNQNIDGWNVEKVSNMVNMFRNVTLSTTNYDALLIGWNAQNLKSNVNFHGGNSTYNSQLASEARANLIDSNEDNWTITDGGRIFIDNTWTGATDEYWHTATNWSTLNVPDNGNNVIKSNINDQIIINTHADVNNITIQGTNNVYIKYPGSLTVEGNFNSGLGGTVNMDSGASLIIKGTDQLGDGLGNFSVGISIPDNKWHLISSPNISNYDDSWITDNSISQGNGNNRAIGIYDNSTDANGNWDYVQAGVSSTAFGLGQGYSIKTDAAEFLGFNGTFPDADVLKTMSIGNIGTADENRWNLMGNPYPSYIKAGDLITLNNANLTDTHRFVYVWDNSFNGTGGYKPITASEYIHPGQGFFVNAANSNTDNFSITESLQSHQTGISFYRTTDPKIELKIEKEDKERVTEIRYEDNSTTGLDSGYDAGTFTGSSNSFNVYTHLVSNSNGIDFMIQSLPKDNYENMIIPIGVSAETNDEITFTIQTLNLPNNTNVYLEDKTLNNFARLDEENSEYNITLNQDLNGIGRFYLHTTSNVLNIDSLSDKYISIYNIGDDSVRIVGLQSNNSIIKIYNILGKLVLQKQLQINGVTDVSIPKLPSGVYFIQLHTEKGKLNKKIILE